MTGEFQGILTLSKNLVQQLDRFLETRETKTCAALLNLMEADSLTPRPTAPASLKLSETVDLLGRKGQKLSGEKISQVLWDYLETLEGCVMELFQQLDQVGVEDWSIELSYIVKAIQESLLHHLDDLKWAIRRLELKLSEFKSPLLFWKSSLDRALRTNLEKCGKYLGFRYKTFTDQYERYMDMHTAIELAVDRFSENPVFKRLDAETQEKFKRLYRLVKLWHLNNQQRALPRRETVRAVRNAMSPDRAHALFKEYDRQLWKALFEKSDILKELPTELIHPGNVNRLKEQVGGFRQELKTVSLTLYTFRDFLLKSNPGIRAKPQLGFSEWSLGPENPEVQRFSQIGEDLKTLDDTFEAFSHSLDKKGVAPDPSLDRIDPEIQAVLHEMTQPLISRTNMKSRSEHFISRLQSLDLLANGDKRVVEYVGNSLNRAIGADWQFQTLFEVPGFHQMYHLYQGLIAHPEERTHLNRMQKFKRLIQQLGNWIKDLDAPRHMHEIELDLSDLKGYLQDFLAQAQRLSREEEKEKRVTEMAHQLLEYRYLFGNFFHHLIDESIESRTLRKQLLFVDQYFEAVDQCLRGV